MAEGIGPVLEANALNPTVSVTVPYSRAPDLVFGRCAVRSEQFGPNAAAGGAPVVIGSAAGRSEADVSLRARSELWERAGNILAGRRAESRPHLVGTFAELNRHGAPVLDPAGLPGATEAVRAAPMMWVEGRSVITGVEMLVPAGAVYLRHRPPPGCAAAIRAGSTGLSAHRSPEAAVTHAAKEILERDALVRAWYDDPDSVVVRAGPPVSGSAGQVCRALDLRARIWVVELDGDENGLIAQVSAPDSTGPAFGARCGDPDDPTAVASAVYEALMVRWSMSTPAAQAARTALRERGGAPRTGIEHAVHAFDTGRAGSYLDARVTRRSGSPRNATTDPLTQLHRATGADVVAVDTSLPELEGVSVVRLIAPGTRQLPSREPPGHPVAHPFG